MVEGAHPLGLRPEVALTRTATMSRDQARVNVCVNLECTMDPSSQLKVESSS